MESNRADHYFFKYAFLFAGLIIMIVPVVSFLIPDSVTINGDTEALDDVTIIIVELIGLISIVIFFAVKDKFVIVELTNQTVIIKQNGEENTVRWLDVITISQFRFVQPPLYKLKTKDSEEAFWFNTESKYISVGGFTSDLSAMGALISKKKRELGI